MPIGFYYRRQAPNFELVQGGKGRQSSFSAYCWLTWKEIELKTNIVHEFSNGGEFRVGAKKLPVDGYSEDLNRVFEFQGKFYNKKNNNSVRFYSAYSLNYAVCALQSLD